MGSADFDGFLESSRGQIENAVKELREGKLENEILKTANFGKKSLNEIKSQLKNLGLTLNMVVPDWPPKTDVQELLKEHIQQQK